MAAAIAEREAAGELLPHRGGALHLAEILRQTGLRRDQLTKNGGLRGMLSEYAARHGLAYSRKGAVAPAEDADPDPEATVPLARHQDALRRLAAAERRCAELRAENLRLRTQILQEDEVSALIARGGRFRPGPE